eukprot:maker-scaffold1754_size28903-snap-gene-0.10 protein:Tk09275 transcript:maker-scaffold1754_size28903-snap-gene-0.10-mRNA-1 annotation:"f-box only protein 7-like"
MAKSFRLGDDAPDLLPEDFEAMLQAHTRLVPNALTHLALTLARLMQEVGFEWREDLFQPTPSPHRSVGLDFQLVGQPNAAVRVSLIPAGPVLIVHGVAQDSDARTETISFLLSPAHIRTDNLKRPRLAARFQRLNELSRTFKDTLAWPMLHCLRSWSRWHPVRASWLGLPPELHMGIRRYLDPITLSCLDAL